MNLLSILLDLIVVAIIILFTFISAKRGFVRTLIEIVGFVLVILFVNAVSQPLADFTYNKAVEPAIVNSTQGMTSGNVSEVADKVFENVPTLLQKALNNGNVYENLKASISENIDNGVQTAVSKASQNVIKPVVSGILSMIYSILIMIILLFVVGILARVINKLFSFSFIGVANRILGGILGAFKGVGVAILVCTIITLTVSLTGGFLIFRAQIIENSVLFKIMTLSI